VSSKSEDESHTVKVEKDGKRQRFFESSIKRLFKVYKTKKETEIFLLAQKRDPKITRKNFEDKMMFNQRSTGQEVVSEKTETENQCKLV
jgi:hypothetical protein